MSLTTPEFLYDTKSFCSKHTGLNIWLYLIQGTTEKIGPQCVHVWLTSPLACNMYEVTMVEAWHRLG